MSIKRPNEAQAAAINQIDGSLMIIAGPGTGKTQLLALRVANILKKTDTDPRSILCLTFTESAAANMTERLSQIIGSDAYKVAIHTFHSFGSEIISRHPEYFYGGALFRPADELMTLAVLNEILESLPHNNPLATTMNGRWTYLGELARVISDFKKAGLAPDEIRELLAQNLAFCANITPTLRRVFAGKIVAATCDAAAELMDEAEKAVAETPRLAFSAEPTLAEVFGSSLRRALDETKTTNKTKPLTEWKKTWTVKNPRGDLILKDDKLSQKLLLAAEVYAKYMDEMPRRGLYDFDDMILRVITAIEQNPDLKSELQETFQYVLVDEFQDTNDAQMRLLHLLTDYDTEPNLMVVGDDDQAIYRFQGADISNIQQFAVRFPNLTVVSLSENYRSGEAILDLARRAAAQISERLLGADGSTKKLIKKVEHSAKVRRVSAATRQAESAFVAGEIRRLIDAKTNPETIAVIARNHRQLESLLPFLAEQNLAVDYERRRDVLSSEPIRQLIHLSLVVEAISRGVTAIVDEYLPQVLAHPAWNIPPAELWRISLTAHDKKLGWLDVLATDKKSAPLADWLQTTAQLAQNEPLEIILDKLIGSDQTLLQDPGLAPNRQTVDDEAKRGGDGILEEMFGQIHSPLYNYFFSAEALDREPESYLNFLADLTTLRDHLRDWRPNKSLRLIDFLDFVREIDELGKPLTSNFTLATKARIKLLTAHKAKGSEFDHVFIIGANSEIWGSKTRTRGSLLGWPHNMPFRLSGDNDDERLRLLFVALTRARKYLTMTSAETDGDKPLLPLEYTLDLETEKLPPRGIATAAEQLSVSWHAPLATVDDNLRDLLSDRLANYKISASHFGTFIDVMGGGPEEFLLKYLLRFPTARSPQAIFGTAIHTALQWAHTHLAAAQQTKPLEDVIGDFENILMNAELSLSHQKFYLKKGVDALNVFLPEHTKTFTPQQKTEQHFDAVVGEMRLTGLIDLIDIDKKKKKLVLIDYKTGKAPRGWRGQSDYEKVKLHGYRHQLMFYKLLIENSREFAGWSAEKGVLKFVEPLDGQLVKLELDFDEKEMAEFIKLLKKVWLRIMTLDLPTIDKFTPNLAGVIDFEKFLLGKE
ncbi:ATP-dependent helicase [Candidatus Saccharibacteria bacterium]|nr:ATP-dependent helicase [Candidatus Saccharibacteria bacterium]